VPSANQLATVKLEASSSVGLQALRGFAEFWKILYTDNPASISHQVALSSGAIPDPSTTKVPTVLSPLGDDNARQISERYGIGSNQTEALIRLSFSRKAGTSIRAKTYNFKGAKLKTLIESAGTPVLSRLDSTNLYLLSIDLASTFNHLLSNGLEDRPSLKFRLATQLPWSYRMIPSFMRNRAFRKDEDENVTKENLSPIECLRTIFLASLLAASDMSIPFVGFWKRGKKFGATVTHDVETAQGLIEGSKHLLSVEHQFGIRSTWNIVSNRYQLTQENLKPLATSGEIGGHDTNHDGRLIFLPAESRANRLRDCRETLERKSQSRVSVFRAPLLQHDKELLTAVSKAGYTCDSSVPSWELLSPTSLRSHGVGTVFPMQLEGLVEVPVSLPQDHQLLRVRSLSSSEAATILVRESQVVREIGGICSVLVHPDYDFASQPALEEYSRVLRSFTEDSACQLMTLSEVSDWWSHRQAATLQMTSNGLAVDSPDGSPVDDLHLEVARGFDENGFVIEEFN